MRKFCSVALTLVIAIVAALSLMVEPAHADLVRDNTRLRVVPASEIFGGHFKVFYGQRYLFISGGLMDVTEQFGAPEGMVYKPIQEGQENFDLFIQADPNFVITSARIIKGSVEYYSRGKFVTETTSIDIPTPTNLLMITAEQLNYGSGTIKHVTEWLLSNQQHPELLQQYRLLQRTGSGARRPVFPHHRDHNGDAELRCVRPGGNQYRYSPGAGLYAQDGRF